MLLFKRRMFAAYFEVTVLTSNFAYKATCAQAVSLTWVLETSSLSWKFCGVTPVYTEGSISDDMPAKLNLNLKALSSCGLKGQHSE